MEPENAIEVYLSQNVDRDVIVISQGITRDLHRALTQKVRANQRHEKCTLFLTTYGGDPDGAYRIARCLRHHYKHLRIVIPSYCKSAGTLITIVADELVIGDLGELGPLDIQVLKNSELSERSSGLDIIQALGAARQHAQDAFHAGLINIRNSARLSTKLAGEFAATIAVGVAGPLYAQIDPIRLGEMQRAMRIAHEYGQRLNRYTNALLEGALDKLVADYPAHGFVIDRKEASELFRTVKKPTEAEDNFCITLASVLDTQSGYGPEFISLPQQPEEDSNGPNLEEPDQQVADTGQDIQDGVVPGTPAPPDGQGGEIRFPRE
ncbi:hypothetical protein RA280_16725 [Cupriavidus sp. CV2]|uniref:SDH family Clp fold serine proteinase n=1 Tax=Cupriavidus ulmosensis TaxID=3065913 RepID=UPI00296B0921|nr:hypothetical protein [Cupriavidus sp. CV2]MDW3683360.1 hypothetical protein [Cupriavidus sp. CV2]